MAGLCADRVEKSIGHGAVIEGAHNSPSTVHGQVARRPNRWRSDITRENRVLRGEFVKHASNVLRVNRLFARLSCCQFVQVLTRLAVMLQGVLQMSFGLILPQLWHQGSQCSLRVSHETKVNLRASSELLASNVNLNDGCVFRKELLVREIGSNHQQDFASHHGVIPGGVSEQAGHADIKRIVVLDKLFPAQGVHDRRLQLARERNQHLMSPGAACSAQDRYFFRLIQNLGELLYLAVRRTNIRAWIRKMEAWPVL